MGHFVILCFSIMALFMSTAYGNENNYVTPDPTRFDGVYTLVEAKGKSTYYSPYNCDEPKVIDKHTIDARKGHCDFRASHFTADSVCSTKLFIRGKDQVITYSDVVDPAQANPYSSFLFRIEDKNYKDSSCTGLNIAVCAFMRGTTFYDKIVNKSGPDFVSRSTIKSRDNKEYISFQIQSSTQLKVTQKAKLYWASGDFFKDKMNEHDVECFYQKESN